MRNSSIKFDFHKNPSSSLTQNEGTYHVRINNSKTVNLQDISETLEHRTTVTRSDIMAVLLGIRSILVEELSQGNAINLDDICRLQPQLGIENGICTGKERGDQLVLRSIKVQPSKALVTEVREQLKPCERCHVFQSIHLSEEELNAAMHEYFKDHSFVTRQQLQTYLGVTRYKATSYLKHYVKCGYLMQPAGMYGSMYFPCKGCFGID